MTSTDAAVLCAALIVLWAAAGLYAPAVYRRGPAVSPGLLHCLATGPVALYEALVMSTKPMPTKLIATNDALPSDPAERDRALRPSKLPSRPKRGHTHTVCPVCSERAGAQVAREHDRDALCLDCGVPNRWLIEHWNLDVSELIDDHAPYRVAARDVIVDLAGREWDPCRSCFQRGVPDARGDCAFCGAPLGELVA